MVRSPGWPGLSSGVMESCEVDEDSRVKEETCFLVCCEEGNLRMMVEEITD